MWNSTYRKPRYLKKTINQKIKIKVHPLNFCIWLDLGFPMSDSKFHKIPLVGSPDTSKKMIDQKKTKSKCTHCIFKVLFLLESMGWTMVNVQCSIWLGCTIRFDHIYIFFFLALDESFWNLCSMFNFYLVLTLVELTNLWP